MRERALLVFERFLVHLQHLLAGAVFPYLSPRQFSFFSIPLQDGRITLLSWHEIFSSPFLPLPNLSLPSL